MLEDSQKLAGPTHSLLGERKRLCSSASCANSRRARHRATGCREHVAEDRDPEAQPHSARSRVSSTQHPSKPITVIHSVGKKEKKKKL